MSRRVVPCAFLAFFLMGVVLPLAVRVQALGSPARVPRVLGSWDGFFQGFDNAGGVGLVRSIIYHPHNHQANLGFLGDAEFLSLDARTRFNAINFGVAFAENGFITGSGRALTGQVSFLGGLDFSAEGHRAAGVMEPEFVFTSASGRGARVPAVLLRPFEAHHPPDISGTFAGTICGQRAHDLRARLTLTIPPVDGGNSFPGEMHLMIPTNPQLYQVLATTSDHKTFVMISQGPSGRLVAEGTVKTGPAGGATAVNALYRLILNEQAVQFGAMNFSLAPLE